MVSGLTNPRGDHGRARWGLGIGLVEPGLGIRMILDEDEVVGAKRLVLASLLDSYEIKIDDECMLRLHAFSWKICGLNITGAKVVLPVDILCVFQRYNHL